MRVGGGVHWGKGGAGSDGNGRATGSHLSAPLLTVAMEIDNVIGHAVRETPRRIKRGRCPSPTQPVMV